MTKIIKSLDDLEKGIEHLLLKNRCSFSDEEVEMLNSCIVLVKQARDYQDLNFVIKILATLSKLFIAGDKLKNFFE